MATETNQSSKPTTLKFTEESVHAIVAHIGELVRVAGARAVADGNGVVTARHVSEASERLASTMPATPVPTPLAPSRSSEGGPAPPAARRPTASKAAAVAARLQQLQTRFDGSEEGL